MTLRTAHAQFKRAMGAAGRIAVWWAEDYAYAAIWQIRGLVAGSPTSYLSGNKRPIVVIPGIWESWAFMLPLVKPLHRAGHPVHVIGALRRNNRTVLDTAQIVSDYITQKDLHNVVVVAHSKGGLIGKYLMTFFDGDARIDSMVAICSPFSGSRYARYLLLPSLRAFSPRDPTTLLLQADVRSNERIVSIYSQFDPHIPEGSELAGATNIVVATGGHFRILDNPNTLRETLKAAGRQRRASCGL